MKRFLALTLITLIIGVLFQSIDKGFGDSGLIEGVKRELSGDYKGAIIEYNKHISLNPKDAVGYVGRGNAKAGLRQYHAAIKDYDKAIELDPKNAVAYANRGNAKAE